jgi:hypothetical protein
MARTAPISAVLVKMVQIYDWYMLGEAGFGRLPGPIQKTGSIFNSAGDIDVLTSCGFSE